LHELKFAITAGARTDVLDVAHLFKKANLQGTFVLLEAQTGQTLRYNPVQPGTVPAFPKFSTAALSPRWRMWHYNGRSIDSIDGSCRS
jgi:hypothetical protein